MGRRLYSALLYALSPLIWRRLRRERLDDHPRGERLGRIPAYHDERVLWVHAASVGEVITARPLIRSLIDDYPDHRVIVTTMTATGARQVQTLFGDLVTHHFVALDFPGATRRFVARLDPEIAIIVETEIWPNLIHACAMAGVPVTIVNARITERGFARYQRFPKLMGEAIRRLAWVGAKSAEDAKRFRTLGVSARRLNVTGALKYDQHIDEAVFDAADALREVIGDRPVWVAGSTHEGEETQLLQAHVRLLARFPDALLMMVPRHPQRFGEVAELCLERGMSVVRRSEEASIAPGTQVYLGDTMGELMMLYATGDVAFVGGSLVDIGGHNLLEPAALGLPVVSGPSLSSLGDVVTTLDEAHARVEVESAAMLGETLVSLMLDETRRETLGRNARAVVDANRGALGHTRDYLGRLIRARELHEPWPLADDRQPGSGR
ncbi:lipid IV(A) 3-deoxy-D-manno-octulosonic acid transferase [Kushneria indalinina]|uniref:3-deoxy-D-manno-octulosonic acid transferase n=1 Tax=Kushneria indalinina DSM 14324 TaxID=1122140 RepID=A0A3D9DSL9_9GAMM|nr:lipid IV(A) 3-deoxy-D-manno-octulosonic acid transferase [Kushneria indalinina]REC93758.1 3-deoxy-D-manno-octulosonic-acid transferase [Kushneria indalinina DSM 14324]